MRRYDVTVIYPHKGSRYPRSVETTVEASSIHVAASVALSSTKRQSRGDFRLATGSTVHVRILVGPLTKTSGGDDDGGAE